ncbi:MAG TPA: alpha/beta fold hydrolase [Gammaproteobacteria bacterium]|jgi:dipeptidyl aminopeptidase/acylaminoacyl peptidase|nr:alpha/beta fold hydrolase [Gammaproteobacteria bacterium]
MSKLKLSLSIITLLFGILMLDSFIGFYLGIRPFKVNSTLTPKDFNVPYERVTFLTQDHLKLSGWFIPNKNPKAPTIIVCHGYPADKGNILPSTLFLHQDYQLFYFDFRYLGESEGSYSTIGKNEVDDLLAAITFLKSRGIQQVGVWGYSLGGVVALLTAPKTPAIKAIVAQAPYARLDWVAEDNYHPPYLNKVLGELTRFWAWLFLGYDINKVNPALTASHIAVPTLIIHSKTDHLISLKHATLFQAAANHNPMLNPMVVDYAMHGEHFQGYETMITHFFNTYLK